MSWRDVYQGKIEEATSGLFQFVALQVGGVTVSTGLIAAKRHAGVRTPVIDRKIISAEPQFALAA